MGEGREERTDRHTYRQTNRQPDRQPASQPDRQTDRQTDRYRVGFPHNKAKCKCMSTWLFICMSILYLSTYIGVGNCWILREGRR